MIQLTDAIRSVLNSALADGTPALLGTSTKDGHPQISPKGSIVVFSDTQLCFWERSNRSASKNLTDNPHVAVYYRNAAKASSIPFRAGAIRFYGDVAVAGAADRDKVWELIPEAERKPDPEKKGTAFLINLTSVEELSGTVVMKRD